MITAKDDKNKRFIKDRRETCCFCYSVYKTYRTARKNLVLEDGKVRTTHVNGNLAESTVQNFTETLTELRERIIKADHNFCLSPGITHKNGLPIGNYETKKTTYKVTYKSEADKSDFTVSRSKDHLWRIPGKSSLICFDIDEKFETEKEILKMLYLVDQQLEHAEMLIVHSSKSMLFDEEGNQLYGPRLHIYCVISDGGRVQDYLEYLRIQIWNKDLGHIKVSASGGMLVRSVIDETVFADERIFFESPAELGEGLVSKAPEPRIIQGGIVSIDVCDSITDIERARYKKQVEEAKQDPELVKQANDLRSQYVEKRTVHVQNKTDISKVDAKKVVLSALDSSELESGFPIILSDGTEVLVEEILNNPEKYAGESCLDPIEPDYDGGRVVGYIFVNEDGSVVIHSFARGERNFILKRGKVSSKSHKSWVKEKYDARNLDQSNVIKMCVSRALEYSMTTPEIEMMLLECLEILGVKSKKTEYKKSIHEHVKNQRDFDANERRESGRAELLSTIEKGTYEPSDLLVKIDPSLFPDIVVKKSGEVVVLETDENLDHLLKSYGIKLRNDVIAKLVTVTFPGEDELDAIRGNDGNSASSKIARMKSICCRNNFNDDLIGRMPALEAKYYSNPIQDYFDELPSWDGETDYVKLVVEHMDVHSNYQEFALCGAVHAWFIQGVAAANTGKLAKELYERDPSPYPKEPLPKYEVVLVLQGEQGASKTDFLTSLLPRNLRRYIKTGMTLDIMNKDSVKLAVSGFIVELGELDATFRAGDIARIKSFLSKMSDEIRLPYAPTENSYPRQTIYCASVNDEDFLVDSSGNRRFYVLKVGQLKMVPKNIINGAWAQAVSLYRAGSTWWLTKEQEKLQKTLNRQHSMRNDYSDLIDCYFKPGKPYDGDSIFVCLKVLQEVACKGNVNSSRFRSALKAAGFDTVPNPTTCSLSNESLRGRYVRLTEAGKQRILQLERDGAIYAPKALNVIQELTNRGAIVLDDDLLMKVTSNK